MAKLSIKAGTTSKSVGVFIQDSSRSDAGGLTGLTYNTSGLTAYWYQPRIAASTAITLVTLSGPTAAFSSGGFVEMDATHAPGHYRLDIPNVALTGATDMVVVLRGATNMAQVQLEIELTATDNQDAVRGGLSALPNTSCTTNASLITSGTGTDQLSVTAGIGKANAVQWVGGTIPAVNVTGIPLVDAKYLLGTIFTTPATAGVLDINVKNIANAAVSTTTAQLGVNVVKINAQTATAAAGVTFPSSIASPTNLTAGTIALVNTLTTYTGNTPQTGDSFARIGAAGAALTANQLSGTHQSVFGNWSDVWILVWGDGIDFVVDRFTQSPAGRVIVTAHLWFNILVRHPQSFCVSADPANQ